MSSPREASKKASAYIVSARRSTLGRVGGVHRNRRIEDLAAPIIAAALEDAGIATADVDEIVIGNASQGGNPARIIAMAAGLPLSAPALTIDRQCGSGLDAVLHAIRLIDSGEADIVVAGGVESLSTAPWRIAKPKSLYQLPHFIGMEPPAAGPGDVSQPIVASEALAQRHQISRAQQDAFAMKSHLRSETAREGRRFQGEIVPFRASREEMRDESAFAASLEDIESETAYCPPDGTLTPANTAQPHDGAAIVVVVSEEAWRKLGQPPALRLIASAAEGVEPDMEADAPIAAMNKLYRRLNGFDRASVQAIELSETSAAQAIAVMGTLGIDDGILNSDGGAIVRGHPLGASGAVLVVRLFTRLIRRNPERKIRRGAVTLGVIGGLGLAAMFETI